MNLRATRRLQDGRYVLLGLLREGGEAVVWRALDTRDGSERALKIYPADDGGGEAAARELALARRVAHPNVVRVDDSFVEDGSAFVVMELAEGSLAERVALLGPLAPREAAAALAGPLAALGAAHAAGVVHRDVKPHNLLVFSALDGRFGEDATVKLGDFGIAQLRAEGTTRTRSGTLLGSLPFLSPEQRRDPKRVGPPTDVYAAAVTLAWLVTGEAPGDLYLPETLAELAAKLRARGVPEGEARWVVARVAAGGRLGVSEREGLGVWALGLVGGPDDDDRGDDSAATGGGLTQRTRDTEKEKGGGGIAEPGVGGGGSGASKVDSWGGEGGPPFHVGPRNAPPLGRARLAWVLGAAVVALGAVALTTYTYQRYSPNVSDTSVIKAPSITLCDDSVRAWIDLVHPGPRESTGADLADVDGDGYIDALFANHLDETVSVWWGRAGSMPETRTDIAIGRILRAPAVGDIDGDGIPDLVGAEQDRAALAVVRGAGARTFHVPEALSQDPAPMSVALAHVDADHLIDVVMTHEPAADVTWRRGTGATPSFAQHRLLYRHTLGLAHWLTGPPAAPSLVYVNDHQVSRIKITNGATRRLSEHNTPLSPLDVIPDASHPDALTYTTLVGTDLWIVRLLADGVMCKVGALGFRHAPRAIGDLDQDGLPDLVEPVTCQSCPSNHVFWRGVR